MHKKDCGVIALAFFVRFGHLLVDVKNLCFCEIFENIFGILLPECDSLGVQVASQNCGVVGIVNHLDYFKSMLICE